MKKFYFSFGFLLLSLAFIFCLNLFAAGAQEAFDDNSDGGLILDEVEVVAAIGGELNEELVEAEEFGLAEPKILPNNPWYWAKNLWRGLRLFATFDPVKKSELRLQIANERLLELQKMAEKGEISSDQLEGILTKYDHEIEKINDQFAKIGEKYQTRLERLKEQYGNQELIRQRLLNRLNEQTSSEVVARAKERSLWRWAENLSEVDQEKLENQLDQFLNNQSARQNFYNLEVLKELENKVPEPAREAIKRAGENALRRVTNQLEEMTSETRQEMINQVLDRAEDFIKNEAMEIIEQIENLSQDQALRRQIQSSVQERAKKGIIDDCFCIEVYQPVCGVDGQTYSNACKAGCAGVAVAYEGECRS